MQAGLALPYPSANWRQSLVRGLLSVGTLLLFGQALAITQARPQELITGVGGMADIFRRAVPPDGSVVQTSIGAAVETFDIALVGTAVAVLLSLPLAVLAARNASPSPALYQVARGVIAVTRAVPDLIWALFFVTAVGLGPFPGVLAQSVHSIGMLGRLFAETIEDMDMGPVEALTVTGASRSQIVTHAILPGILPSLIGIALYRLDENVRSSLVLGFVGAGGIGFLILTYMNLFQYRKVATLLVMTYVLVVVVERVSAAIRRRVQ